MKLYFVTVPTLVDFYKSQNQLAAEGARTQASLETQAALTREQIAANAKEADKRLKQEAMLEQYKQQMLNLREARSASSEEQKLLTQELAAEMRAKLGRESNVEVAKIGQQGAMERQLAGLQAQAPERAAKTEAAQQLATTREQARPLQQQKLEAETMLAQEKQRIASSPDLQGIMTEVKQFKDQEKQLKQTLGKEGYNKMLDVLKQRSMSLGVDLNNNPAYLEASSEARKEAIAKTQESLKTFGEDSIRQGAIVTFMDNLSRLQDAVASGAYSEDEINAARQKLSAFAKSTNLPTEYTELI